MRRRIASAILLVPLLLVVGVVLLVVQDPNRYRPELALLLSEAAGHPVELHGDVSLRWRPSPTLTARDLRMIAPDGQGHADTVRVVVEPWALLARRLRAREVVVKGVRVQLTGTPVSSAVTVLPDPGALPVERLEISELEMRRGDSLRLRLERLVMSDPDSPDGPRVALDMPAPALRGTARVRVRGAQLHLSELDVSTDAGRVEGRLSLAMDGPRPRLTGALAARALSVPGRRDRAGGPLVPQFELDASPLALLDVDVRLRVGRLSLGDVRVNGFEVPLVVRDGALGVRTSGELAGGPLSVHLQVTPDPSGAAPGLALDLSLDEADAGALLVMLGAHGAEKGGRARVRAHLAARGTERNAVLASLEGSVAVDAVDLTFRASAAELAASDLFAGLTRSLRGDDGNRVQVECAVARFPVRGGVLASGNGIGLQSRASNVLGGGSIDLLNDRMDLLLRPWPREGLGLSATALVGNLAVSGPIRDPEVSLTSEAVWRGGATAGAAVLTAGLSLIAQGLLERARGDAPCAQAAGTPVPAGGRASGDEGGAVEGAARRVGRALQDLFGGGGAVDTDPESGGADR